MSRDGNDETIVAACVSRNASGRLAVDPACRAGFSAQPNRARCRPPGSARVRRAASTLLATSLRSAVRQTAPTLCPGRRTESPASTSHRIPSRQLRAYRKDTLQRSGGFCRICPRGPCNRYSFRTTPGEAVRRMFPKLTIALHVLGSNYRTLSLVCISRDGRSLRTQRGNAISPPCHRSASHGSQPSEGTCHA